MRACTRTHQSLYERHSGGTLIFVNAVAFHRTVRLLATLGPKREFFYSLVRRVNEMSTGGFTSHYFLILNLLSPSELQSSKAIADEIIDAQIAQEEALPVVVRNCISKDQLSEALDQAELRLRTQGEIPIIHLDGHSDRDCVHLPSGPSVAWSEVFQRLRVLNVLACNNIFLTCGACESAYALQGSEIIYPSPVFGLLAPVTKVQAGDVTDGFRAFYRTLIETSDGPTALEKFMAKVDSSQYSVLFSAALFEKSAAKYIDQHCRGQGRLRRQEALLTRAVQEVPNIDIKQARKKIKTALRQDAAESLREMFRTYLILDSCPKNVARFPFRRARIHELARRERLAKQSSQRSKLRG